MLHLSLNVEEGEGVELSEQYKVGNTYPVFILTDSNGEVIERWTGYAGSNAFASKLKKALSDPTALDKRIARFKAEPTLDDALSLAKYYSDAGEHLKAVEYYRQAESLGKGHTLDYSYQIFINTANAAWKDMIDFDEVLPAADSVLTSKLNNRNNVSKVAMIMGRLAREKGKTNQITKYLQAGLEATANSHNKNLRESHDLIMAEYALYVNADTTEAIRIKKASMGKGWEENRDKFYSFAKWCLERKINLEEAEIYARRTVDLVYPGKYRAKVLNTLAEICYAQGNTEKSIKLIKMAIGQEPDNEYYAKQLLRFQEKLSRQQQ